MPGLRSEEQMTDGPAILTRGLTRRFGSLLAVDRLDLEMAEGTILMVVTLVLGVHLKTGLLSLLGMVLAVFLGAALFSTFSLVIACIVKTRERFMGIGQVLTMPLFFASNAIYPTVAV